MNSDVYNIVMAIANFLDYVTVVAVISFAVYKVVTKIIAFYFREKSRYNK